MIFSLKLDILVWLYREYIKAAKMAACGEGFLYGDDFAVTLAIFCSYGYGTNASESVQKITTDEKVFHKYFVSVIVFLTTTYQ